MSRETSINQNKNKYKIEKWALMPGVPHGAHNYYKIFRKFLWFWVPMYYSRMGHHWSVNNIVDSLRRNEVNLLWFFIKADPTHYFIAKDFGDIETFYCNSPEEYEESHLEYLI